MYEDRDINGNIESENPFDDIMSHICEFDGSYDSDFQTSMMEAYWEVTEVKE